MKPDRYIVQITTANLIARSAYQMGKTPLLPLFAASLGASDVLLGVIVSVSTLTGMVFKPFIGALSDRWGRRIWLMVGTAFFALMPFTYWFVHTPAQLFSIRIIHGIATAIYGPVTLAYITERWPTQRAERLGWFDSARTAGYILGPATAGWLLLSLEPAVIFTLIGAISCVVFIPVLSLPESLATERAIINVPIFSAITNGLKISSHTSAVWLSGSLEAITYIATYAMKAFLPLHALAQGTNVAVIGLFFGVQEGVTLVLKPACGKLGDRIGMRLSIALGMLVMGVTFIFLPVTTATSHMIIIAGLIGAAQAMIFPSTTALVAEQIHGRNLGAGMGLLGTMRNAGKVIGPILGGLLINRFEFTATFGLLGLIMLTGALAIESERTIRRSLNAFRRKKLDHPLG